MARVRTELEEVDSKVYPGLERKPGKQNWVDKAGGLPSLIERVAKHLHYEKGYEIGRAIATAVNWCKKMCSTGTAFGGKVKVKATSQAAACAAVSSWEAKKGKSAAKSLAETPMLTLEEAAELRDLATARLTLVEGMLITLAEPRTNGKRGLVSAAQDLLEANLGGKARMGLLGGPAADPRAQRRTAEALQREADELRTFVGLFGGDLQEAKSKDPVKQAEARVKKASERTRTAKNGKDPAKKDGKDDLTLKKGRADERVNQAQSRLGELGYDVKPDGKFGDHTEASVRAFQKDHSLKEDGVLGPNTRVAMRGSTPEEVQERRTPKGDNEKDEPEAKGGKTARKSAETTAQKDTPVDTSDWLTKGRGVGGDPDSAVEAAQKALHEMGTHIGDAGPDGRFGPETEKAVKRVQRRYGLKTDGLVGPQTRNLLARHGGKHGKDVEESQVAQARAATRGTPATHRGLEGQPPRDRSGQPIKDPNFEKLHPRAPLGRVGGGQWIQAGNSGGQVRRVQNKLGVKVDGTFGAKTEAAVRKFQVRHGLEVDGIVGHQTAAALTGHKNADKVTPGALTGGDHSRFGYSGSSNGTSKGSSQQRSSSGSGKKDSYAGSSKSSSSDSSSSGSSSGSTLQVGSSSPTVRRIASSLGINAPNKEFDNKLEAAVKRFQREQGLQVDGVVGRQTARALLGNENASSVPVGALTGKLEHRLANGKLAGTGNPKPRRGKLQEAKHYNVKCPKCDEVQAATHKKCRTCGHDLKAARKGKFANADLQEATLTRAAGGLGRTLRDILSIKRLPDGTFAPEGRGRVLRPHEKVRVLGSRGRVSPDGKSVLLGHGQRVRLASPSVQRQDFNQAAQGITRKAEPTERALAQLHAGMRSPGTRKGSKQVGEMQPGTIVHPYARREPHEVVAHEKDGTKLKSLKTGKEHKVPSQTYHDRATFTADEYQTFQKGDTPGPDATPGLKALHAEAEADKRVAAKREARRKDPLGGYGIDIQEMERRKREGKGIEQYTDDLAHDMQDDLLRAEEYGDVNYADDLRKGLQRLGDLTDQDYSSDTAIRQHREGMASPGVPTQAELAARAKGQVGMPLSGQASPGVPTQQEMADRARGEVGMPLGQASPGMSGAEQFSHLQWLETAQNEYAKAKDRAEAARTPQERELAQEAMGVWSGEAAETRAILKGQKSPGIDPSQDLDPAGDARAKERARAELSGRAHVSEVWDAIGQLRAKDPKAADALEAQYADQLKEYPRDGRQRPPWTNKVIAAAGHSPGQASPGMLPNEVTLSHASKITGKTNKAKTIPRNVRVQYRGKTNLGHSVRLDAGTHEWSFNKRGSGWVLHGENEYGNTSMSAAGAKVTDPGLTKLLDSAISGQKSPGMAPDWDFIDKMQKQQGTTNPVGTLEDLARAWTGGDPEAHKEALAGLKAGRDMRKRDEQRSPGIGTGWDAIEYPSAFGPYDPLPEGTRLRYTEGDGTFTYGSVVDFDGDPPGQYEVKLDNGERRSFPINEDTEVAKTSTVAEPRMWSLQGFQEGDKVELPDGQTATVDALYPQTDLPDELSPDMVGVKSSDGQYGAFEPDALKRLDGQASPGYPSRRALHDTGTLKPPRRGPPTDLLDRTAKPKDKKGQRSPGQADALGKLAQYDSRTLHHAEPYDLALRDLRVAVGGKHPELAKKLEDTFLSRHAHERGARPAPEDVRHARDEVVRALSAFGAGGHRGERRGKEIDAAVARGQWSPGFSSPQAAGDKKKGDRFVMAGNEYEVQAKKKGKDSKGRAQIPIKNVRTGEVIVVDGDMPLPMNTNLLDDLKQSGQASPGVSLPRMMRQARKAVDLQRDGTASMTWGTTITRSPQGWVVDHGGLRGTIGGHEMRPVLVADALENAPEEVRGELQDAWKVFADEKASPNKRTRAAQVVEQLAGGKPSALVMASPPVVPSGFEPNTHKTEIHEIQPGTTIALKDGSTYVVHKPGANGFIVTKPVDADGKVLKADPASGKSHGKTTRVLHGNFAPTSIGGISPEYEAHPEEPTAAAPSGDLYDTLSASVKAAEAGKGKLSAPEIAKAANAMSPKEAGKLGKAQPQPGGGIAYGGAAASAQNDPTSVAEKFAAGVGKMKPGEKLELPDGTTVKRGKNSMKNGASRYTIIHPDGKKHTRTNVNYAARDAINYSSGGNGPGALGGSDSTPTWNFGQIADAVAGQPLSEPHDLGPGTQTPQGWVPDVPKPKPGAHHIDGALSNPPAPKAPKSPARSEKGNLRNFGAMSDEKLQTLAGQMEGHDDPEAIAAIDAEMAQRETDTGAPLPAPSATASAEPTPAEALKADPGTAASVAEHMSPGEVAELPHGTKIVKTSDAWMVSGPNLTTPELHNDPHSAVERALDVDDVPEPTGDGPMPLGEKYNQVAALLGGPDENWGRHQVNDALTELADQHGIPLDAHAESPETLAAVIKAANISPLKQSAKSAEQTAGIASPAPAGAGPDTPLSNIPAGTRITAQPGPGPEWVTGTVHGEMEGGVEVQFDSDDEGNLSYWSPDAIVKPLPSEEPTSTLPTAGTPLPGGGIKVGGREYHELKVDDNIVSANEVGSLSGRTVVVTGKLEGETRKTITAKLQAQGALVLSGVEQGPDFLIVGQKAGSKLKKARAAGTAIIPDEILVDLLEALTIEEAEYLLEEGAKVLDLDG